MARPGSLRAEASCPLCLGLFQEPVSIHCGHNFCRGCIERCWASARGRFPCPRCRTESAERSLRPNRELAALIRIAQRLSLRGNGTGAGTGSAARRCPRHGEELKLFCEEEQSPVCRRCRHGPEHRLHAAVPIEEAAQEHREKLQAHAQILRARRERMLRLKAAEEGKSLELLELVDAQRQRLRCRVRELQRLLQQRERLLLARLAALDREIVRRQEQGISRLSEHISRLEQQLRELEEKCEQPPWELLQDSRDILSRLENQSDPELLEEPPKLPEEPPEPVEDPPEVLEEPPEPLEEPPEPLEEPPEPVEEPPEPLEEPREPLEEPPEPLEEPPEPLEEPPELPEEAPEPLEESPEPLEEPPELLEEPPELPEEPREPLEEPREPLEEPPKLPQKNFSLREMLKKFEASLTLDPDTAHPRLALSEDGKSVRWEDTRRSIPDHPKRFDSSRCVLAREGFTSGRHFWQVRVAQGTAWAVGVAKASVARKGRLRVRPEAGVWAVGQCGAQCQALSSPAVPIALPAAPRVVGVYLDYEAGRVAFFEALREAPMFAFAAAEFGGERLLPLLCLGRGCRFWLSP